MKIEFNKGKIEDKEKEEVKDEEVVEVETKKEFIRQNDLKKPLLKIAIVSAAVLGVLLIILLLVSLMTPKTRSFEDIEAIMKQAAMDYFAERKNYLPSKVGDVREVDVANLVAAEKMKDLSEYTDENTVCSGRVEVEKTDDSYVYSPYLDCGDSYVTIELYKKVQKDSPIISSGYGLYSQNGNYVFRGETVNNYVKIGNTMWRILRINSDNTISLVQADIVKIQNDVGSTGYVWDDRYNPEKENNYGINNFGPSRIHENLIAIYDENYEDEVIVMTKADKEKFVLHDLCIGKRSSQDTSKDNSTECSTKLERKYVGLLTASDYMNASLDTNCTYTTNESCQNYNYLNLDKQFWLITASSENSYDVYSVAYMGGITAKRASGTGGIRLVVRLKNNVFYKSGTGTEADPYILK